MSVQRKRYSAEMKAKIALEAIKGQKTANLKAGAKQWHGELPSLKRSDRPP